MTLACPCCSKPVPLPAVTMVEFRADDPNGAFQAVPNAAGGPVLCGACQSDLWLTWAGNQWHLDFDTRRR